MVAEHNEGPEVKERFEQTMRTLFQAPRPKKPKTRSNKPATLRKQKRSDKN
jgi:hypothetical protein